MEWSERMNAAIRYIEENLEDQIDLAVAAQKACCSTFHFQRVFYAVIGITPAEYARRRRLTLAARDLTSTASKVIDVALKYGYDSPVSFTRAFRNLHGITPQAARIPGAKLTAYPCISFSIKLSGGIDVDYQIIEKPAFNVIGKGRRFTSNQGENFIKIPLFWKEFMASDEYGKLTALANDKTGPVTGAGCLGVMISDAPNWDPFIYAICIEKVVESASGYDEYHIPAATWAVFDCTLPSIQNVTKQIFSEWFPSTGYEHDAKPEIEVYFADYAPTGEMRCQVWIPIKKGNA